MAMNAWNYFTLLMWKNFLIQWRHKVQLVIEILVPVIFCVIAVVVRVLVIPEQITEPTIYKPINIDNFNVLRSRMFYATPIKWQLAYSPENPLIDDLVQKATNSLQISFYGCKNSADLERYMLMSNALAGVDFGDKMQNATKLPENFHYAIRFPGALRVRDFRLDMTWKTQSLFPELQFNGPRNKKDNDGGLPPGYIKEGFIAVQNAISSAYIKTVANNNITFPAIQMERFPYPPYLDDPLLQGLETMISLIILLSFVYPCTLIVKHITVEKEKQLKEVMKIMGLSTWLHWTAWFCVFMIFLLISTALLTMLLKTHWASDQDVAVLTASNGFLLYLFFITFSIVTISFCFLLSSFFIKANTAASIAGLVWFIFYIPYSVTIKTYPSMSLSEKLSICLFSNSAMAYGFQLILKWEGLGTGLQWDNLYEPVTVDDQLTVGHVMGMMIIDAVVYMLITLYLEKVMPGSYGIPEKWYFLFTKSFWFPKTIPYDDLNLDDIGDDQMIEENFEKVTTSGYPGIQIRNLRKVYGKKVAVKGLTLNMYEDEITALLGHNGAGKTTLISMIIGMISPSSGTAIVNGSDIWKNMQGVRMSLGFCPQHNILFSELTVREHIIFYSKLKGLNNNRIKEEIDKYVKLLKLEDKINAQASTLSGGMQRKLSVGVALCGGSKVVLCDEPSSGMDPAARRSMWDLLQADKAGRTILLTTHFMDEADVLGDRIAIMANGKLKCCGSPFFLKKKFGVGYHLICAKGLNCTTPKVTSVLKKYIPEIAVESDIGSELSYQLPDNRSTVFENMLKDIEDSSNDLDLEGCGISLTTLEEVFIRCGEDVPDEDSESDNREDLSSVSGLIFEDNNRKTVKGLTLLMYQCRAMFLKKMYYSLRNWYMVLVQMAIPLFFICVTILIVRMYNQYQELPPLLMSLKSYGTTVTVLRTELPSGSPLQSISEQYQNMFKPTNQDTSLVSVKESVIDYILELAKTILVRVNTRYMAAATISSTGIIAWFNNQAYHSAPLSLNLVHNAMAKAYLGPDHTIEVTNDPLPYSVDYRIQVLESGGTLGFQLALNLCFAMAFVTSMYIMFLIKERESRSKLLQFLSGVNIIIFWGVNFLWDMFIFILTAILAALVLAAFQEEGFTSFIEIIRVLFVILVFGVASLPLTYLGSKLFKDSTTGYSRLTIFNIFTGNALFIVVFVMSVPALDLLDTSEMIQKIFMIFPNFSLAQSLSNLNSFSATENLCEMACNLLPVCNMELVCTQLPQCCTNKLFAWKNPGIGATLVYMSVTAIILFILLFIVEYRLLDFLIHQLLAIIRFLTGKNLPSGPEDGHVDQDVQKEKDRIDRMTMDEIQQHNLITKHMTKYYGNFLAVNQLSVGVERSECFGLLGVNGAGKTSTFKMLTGDEYISYGSAWVQGNSLRNNMTAAYKLIGYCPQFDAVLEDLTGAETLQMYCLLRGIPSKAIPSVVTDLSTTLSFHRHLYKKVKEYSGGNKRKLSTAIALIGNPAVVYLDEPTTGMDPTARRKLWNVLCRVRDAGKSIILTSHSMEECEALCTRLAIMVNGEFKCIGSTQHLKNRFSKGLSLSIKLKKREKIKENGITENGWIDDRKRKSEHKIFFKRKSPHAVEPIHPDTDTDHLEVLKFVEMHFQGAVIKEKHNGVVTFIIPSENIKWSAIFGLMERNKDRLNIEDYSVSQCTLEQVFLEFAKKQREAADINQSAS